MAPSERAADTRPGAVLITGASRGIGAALAVRLAGPGRRLYLNHRDSAADAERAREAAAERGEAVVVRADVADRAAVAAMMAAVAAGGGALDVLVHGAAPPIVPQRVTALDWDRDVRPTVETTCRGLLHCVQEGLPLMRPGSRIVVLLSRALAGDPPARMGAYVVAKSALWGMTRVLAHELGPRGIVVLGVSPGMTGTSLLRHYDRRALEIMGHDLPRGRLASADEVAAAIADVLERPAAQVHGANVVLDA